LTNWKQVDIAGISNTTGNGGGIRTDGTLYMWGNNAQGQLGLNNTTQTGTATQVTGTTWLQLSMGSNHTLAIKSDGTLWAWGNNTNGQLGDASLTSKSSPVQVIGTGWKYATAGGKLTTTAGFSVGIKTDGTLWAWGSNAQGQIGDGTTTTRSSPVQVGSLTNWKSVVAGEHSVAAIKTDGTLWTWGGNGNGQLMDGTVIAKSSPVQVGSLTNWKSVTMNLFNTIATTFCEDYLA
jgi:alpha-tubulin suppressor-like RCC1 family protein